ncbi:MAG: hypothetical protein ACOX81_00580 [Candidatus Heteroscillospira sp.]
MSKETLLQIDTDQELAKIIQKMNTLHDQLAAPDIFRKALNAAGRKVRKQMVADAKEQYAIKDTKALKDKAKGAPEFLSASTSNLTARIRARGPMQDIMAFMTRPNTKTGAAAAKVLNSSAMKELQIENLKAFVATFASGHTAIVQRRGPERLPVKKLLSPSVPHLLNNEKVRAKAAEMTYDILQQEIEKQIAKVWAKTA